MQDDLTLLGIEWKPGHIERAVCLQVCFSPKHYPSFWPNDQNTACILSERNLVESSSIFKRQIRFPDLISETGWEFQNRLMSPAMLQPWILNNIISKFISQIIDGKSLYVKDDFLNHVITQLPLIAAITFWKLQLIMLSVLRENVLKVLKALSCA